MIEPAKPTDTPVRDKLTAFYLTRDDYQLLRRMALEGGFRSPSHLVTSIIEPLLRGWMSMLSFMRSCDRVQKHMERHGVKFGVDWSSLCELLIFRPPPPAIPEDDIDTERMVEDMKELIAMLEQDQARELPQPRSKKPTKKPKTKKS